MKSLTYLSKYTILAVLVLLSISPCSGQTKNTDFPIVARPELMIPYLLNPPVLGDSFNESAWVECSKFTGLGSYQKGGIASTPSWVYVGYDSFNLYVAVINQRDPNRELVKGEVHDGSLWMEDSTELFVAPISGDAKPPLCQFIGASDGATYDAVEADSSWNPGYQYRAYVTPDKWIACWTIFFVNLPGKPVMADGGQIRMNVAINRGSDASAANRSEWSKPGALWTNYLEWGLVRLGSNKSVRIDAFEVDSNSNVKAAAAVTSSDAKLRLMVRSKNDIIFDSTKSISPGQQTSIEHKIDGSGLYDIRATITDFQGKVLWSQQANDHKITGKLGIDLASDPFRNRLLITANPSDKSVAKINVTVKTAAGLPLGVYKLIATPKTVGNVSPRVDAWMPGAKELVATEASFQQVITAKLFDIPTAVLVEAQGFDSKGICVATETARLSTFPKPSWLSRPKGLGNDVPSPWHQVMLWKNNKWISAQGKVFNAKSGTVNTDPMNPSLDLSRPTPQAFEIVRVWGRDYTFSGAPGEILGGVSSLGKQILTSPIRIVARANGKPVIWKPKSLKTGFKGNEYVREATWTYGSSQLKTTNRIMYDGFIWFDIEFSASKPQSFDSIVIQSPMKREVAELYAYANDIPWPNNEGVGTVNKTENIPFCSVLNFVNDNIGIGFSGESKRGWNPNDIDNPLSITPGKKSIVLGMYLADKRITIKNKWSIRFGVNTYPVKPWSSEASQLTVWEPIGYEWGDKDVARLDEAAKDGVKYLCYHEHWNRYYGDGRAYDEAGMKRLMKEAHKRNILIVLYSGAMVSDQAPFYDFYRWPWIGPKRIEGGYPSRYYDDSKMSYAKGVIKNPQAHWNDFSIGSIDMWIKGYGADGTYTDGSLMTEYIDSTQYGHGYIGQNGKLYGSFDPLASRAYAERMYRVIHSSKGNRGIIDTHMMPALPPYSIAFATTSFTGETLAALMKGGKMPMRIPTDYSRATFGRQYGVPVNLYPVAMFIHGLMVVDQVIGYAYAHGTGVRSAGDYWLVKFLQPYWKQSDFMSKSKFIGYWDKNCPVKITNTTDTVASAYIGKGKIQVAIFDATLKTTQRSINLEADKNYNWTDIENNKIIGTGKKVTIELPASGRMLLELEMSE